MVLTRGSDFLPSIDEFPVFMTGLLTGKNHRGSKLPCEVSSQASKLTDQLMTPFQRDGVLITFDRHVDTVLTGKGEKKRVAAMSLGLPIKTLKNLGEDLVRNFDTMRQMVVDAGDECAKLKLMDRIVHEASSSSMRGSVKSSRGKAYGDMYLGGMLLIFDKVFTRDADEFYADANDKFLLSHSRVGSREIDGAVYLNGELSCFEVGFINQNNSDVTSDKMTRHIDTNRKAKRIVLVEKQTKKQRTLNHGAVVFDMIGKDMPYQFGQHFGLDGLDHDPVKRRSFYIDKLTSKLDQLDMIRHKMLQAKVSLTATG